MGWEFENRDKTIAEAFKPLGFGDMRHCLPARWAGGSVRDGNALKRRFQQETDATGHMKIVRENKFCFRTGFT